MSYSSIMGFIEENNLDLSQYSWLGSVFCKSDPVAMPS
jgi:hypothetical protein